MSPAAVSESEVKPSVWSSMATATPGDRRNIRRVGLALGAWAFAWIAATVLIEREAVEGAAAAFVAIPAAESRRFACVL